MPQVSIIMNCLNGEKYLKEAIDSIYAQTYKDWEIIFWDNASTDRSAEIARCYGDKLKYFKGEMTVSLHAARNLALKQAQGKYIAFLDTDDLWLPEKLEQQVPLLEKNPEAGLVYSNVKILEGESSSRLMFSQRRVPSGRVFGELLKHYRLSLPTVVITRAALDSLGEWFDQSLNLAGDTDLFLRIAYNWEVIYLPRITAKYREHGGNLFIKFADDFPREIEYIFEKFSRQDANFRRKYRQQLKAFKTRLQKGLIVSKWKSGKNKEARKIALGYLFNMPIFSVLYLFSFLPYSAVSRFYNNLSRFLRRV